MKEELSYPTKKVLAYLSQSGSVDQCAARIYIKFIQDQYKLLKTIATEIDEEYEDRV